MYRPKNEAANYDLLCKVLIVGDARVGKTSLVSRALHAHAPFNDAYVPTIGVDFGSKYCDLEEEQHRVRVKLQIWDTAGAERFRAVTAAYYRGAKGALILVDLTDRESLDHASKWLQQVDEFALGDVSKVLVGCKCDAAAERRVEWDIAHDFAAVHGVEYVEVSARENINVDYLFLLLTRLMCQRVVEKD